MYAFLVASHNIIRWLVLISGLIAAGFALRGWLGQREWSESDRKTGLIFTIFVDIQLMVGILLYFVYSNWALKAILENGMGFVMTNSTYRFFALEHALLMLLGFVSAHLGSALPKRVNESNGKFKRAAIWFTLSLLLIVMGIPWGSRSLFPGL
jgi:hypothetical protein